MITPEEFKLLCDDDCRQAIAANRDRDPLVVAMDQRVPHARLVATQLKYLSRAALKLPAYAAAGCIIPPRAFEQSSSQACAEHKSIEGDSVLDLTCGLGVDSLALSRSFKRVVSLERDAVLADVAVENFARLGATNIQVVCTSAEEYLRCEGLHFDWIYVDPDRRSAEGRKMVCLEDCSPNIIALQPLMARASGRLCIKNSPLFDVDEALRLFPQSRVEVLSLSGECKEVIIYNDDQGPLLTATALGLGSFSARPDQSAASAPADFDPQRYRYLILSDVALRKARLARLHLAQKSDIWSESGYGFAVQRPNDVLARVFKIEKIEPFDPQKLKKEFKGRRVELLKRDFPLSIEELMRRMGVRSGDDHRLAFTKIGSGFWTIHLK